MGDFYAQNPSVYYALCMLFGALMGVPLTSGFLTKETILAALEYSPTGYILWLSIIFTVLYSLKVLFSLKKSSLDTYKKVSMHTAWGLTLPIYVLAFCSLFWVVSFQPFHINKPQFPEVKLYINGISVITLLLSVGIFWKFKNFILGLSSQIVSEFWGLNALYNIWISKGFISKIEALEKQNHIWINHSLNPLFFMGQTLKFLEEKILVGLILKLRDILVTGKIMNIPVSIAHFFQWLDTYIWDFGILSLTHSVLKIGRFNARLYSGQVQVYWIYSLILILVGSILFYWVMSESSPNILVGE
ncbi:MAG: hypothetical protein KatS3mg035_0607 [Bacteroidia bacterium]|nr:MAG: hypothetical protein KatS3mg035_0607 [Bacteroidia bacterium]